MITNLPAGSVNAELLNYMNNDAMEIINLIEELDDIMITVNEIEEDIKNLSNVLKEEMIRLGIKNLITEEVEVNIDADGKLEVFHRY